VIRLQDRSITNLHPVFVLYVGRAGARRSGVGARKNAESQSGNTNLASPLRWIFHDPRAGARIYESPRSGKNTRNDPLGKGVLIKPPLARQVGFLPRPYNGFAMTHALGRSIRRHSFYLKTAIFPDASPLHDHCYCLFAFFLSQMTVVFNLHTLYNRYMEHTFYYSASHSIPVSGRNPFFWLNLVSQLRSGPVLNVKLMQNNFCVFFISFHFMSTKNAYLLKNMPKIRSFCTHLIDIFPMHFIFISDDRWGMGAGKKKNRDHPQRTGAGRPDTRGKAGTGEQGEIANWEQATGCITPSKSPTQKTGARPQKARGR
jgi:hypothetical protein